MQDPYICDKYLPAMYQRIAHLALVVKDYDEAIQFYTEKLGFTLVEDTPLSEVKRWVVQPKKHIKGYL
jgi:catechol 2,3-dioxygenase-like lactoylglutathione lyase family enzyme